jgi:hypothetical protein
MKEKILALLLDKFAGVRKDALAQLAGSIALQAATDDEAAGIVEKLTPERVNEFTTDYRKTVDKEVSDANKAYEGNLKKKYDFVEKKEPEPGKDPNPANPNDIATIVANAIKAAVEPLQQKIASFEGSKTAETRLQQLQGKFKDKSLPESFTAQKMKDFKRMNFESDEAFAEYLTELDTDITTFNQELANIGLGGNQKPFFGNGGTDEDSFVNTMKEINKNEN